jgi:hypothetical protein
MLDALKAMLGALPVCPEAAAARENCHRSTTSRFTPRSRHSLFKASVKAVYLPPESASADGTNS